MDVEEWIRARGGIAHRRDLAAAGWSADRLRGASLARIGRLWLVAGEPDPLLRRAAEERGRLACVSAATHLGLALLHSPERLHLSVPTTSEQHARAGVRLHRTRPIAPAGRTALVESLPDVLSHTVECLPEVQARIVWESALRQRLIAVAELRRIAWPGPRQRRLAAIVSDRSDSLLETILADALEADGIPFRQQARLLGRPVDFLLGERLVVQVDGFEHHQAAQRRSDIAFDAELQLRGMPVLRFDYAQTLGGDAIRTIRRALAMSAHP